MAITPQEALARVIVHREIFFDEMVELMRQVMRGEVSPVLTAALLAGLRVKKETIDEIAGAATVMREFAQAVPVADTARLVDIVGTGGDGANTFNVSTASMYVCAAAGARVAKHGNRSVSSSSGSADVLQALGVAIELPPAQVAECLAETGLGFMFAPLHHPAMRNVAAVRKELGVRTLFNILGPLTNPAGAPNILMGVFHADLVGIQARVLQRLGAERALVVHGRDGLDEITLSGPTLVAELRDGRIAEYAVAPEDFGIAVSELDAIRVDGPAASRAMVPIRSTFPPPRCSSWPRPAPRSPSTATAACRRNPEAPTCSRRWVRRSNCPRSRCRAASPKPASVSCSRRCTIRR
jgi:anthranilate phosphoribosyltransferase